MARNKPAVPQDPNAAPVEKKKRGYTEGPRALRGAPKLATTWTEADEKRHAELMARREAAHAERSTAYDSILSLLMAGAVPIANQPTGALIESTGLVDANAEPEELAELPVVEQPLGVTKEQLLTNIQANGTALLTVLSKFYKLDVPPKVKAEAAPAEGAEAGETQTEG